MKFSTCAFQFHIQPFLYGFNLRRPSMLAGRDTVCSISYALSLAPIYTTLTLQTGSLLTFVTYNLAMHPQILARLRKEIVGSIGSDRAPLLVR